MTRQVLHLTPRGQLSTRKSSTQAQPMCHNSTRVVVPSIANYDSTTTDHYPVVSRFDFGP